MSFIVIYDACVLYPAALRDLLLELAISELFAAKWTETIHNEWIRGLLRSRPELEERVQNWHLDIERKPWTDVFPSVDLHSEGRVLLGKLRTERPTIWIDIGEWQESLFIHE